MSHKFIAIILAASITFTGLSAAQARALESDTLVKLLAGAAALAIVGSAIKNNRSAPAVARTEPTSWEGWGEYGREAVARPVSRVARELPGECLKKHSTRDGNVRMLGRSCLNRHYAWVDHLPATCRVSADTKKGLRRGYRPKCLRDHGYRLVHK